MIPFSYMKASLLYDTQVIEEGPLPVLLDEGKLVLTASVR